MAGQQVEIVANQIDKQRLGYLGLSLTNYDADTEPQIAAGSKVEIASALFEFTAAESITGWGGIGASSRVYVKLVVAGTAVTAAFTTTAPTWSTSKQGWYGTGGAALDRYVAMLWKDAAGNYSFKEVLGDRSAGGHPIGEVGDLVPSTSKDKPGYLWCDGSTISNVSNAEYTRLIYQLKKEAGADAAHPLYHADADKAKLPDFRGYAIRGKTGAAVSARDQDGDRKVGAYQADGNKAHTHTNTTQQVLAIGLASAGGAGGTSGNYTIPATGSAGNAEATMKNAAAYMLIKY